MPTFVSEIAVLSLDSYQKKKTTITITQNFVHNRYKKREHIHETSELNKLFSMSPGMIPADTITPTPTDTKSQTTNSRPRRQFHPRTQPALTRACTA